MVNVIKLWAVVLVVITLLTGCDKISSSGVELSAPDLGAATTQSVIYRINAGGDDVVASEGRRWLASDAYVNTGNKASNAASINVSDPSVPENTPAKLFNSELWDGLPLPEMEWNLPVNPGRYEVRLYFAETWAPAFEDGVRVFDVLLEGVTVLDDYDIFNDVGSNTAVMKSFEIDADDDISIQFQREAQNPMIKAIEIINVPTDTGSDSFYVSHEIELEDYDSLVPSSNHTWERDTNDENPANDYMVTTPDDGTLLEDISDSPMLAYNIEFGEAGRYFVWVRGLGDTDSTGEGKSDSLHMGLNGELLPGADKIDSFPSRWGWTQQTRDDEVAYIDIPQAGTHTINVWMREDGVSLDKFILTTDPSFSPPSEIEVEAEDFDNIVNTSTHSWVPVSAIDASGQLAVVTTPDSGRLNTTIDNSPMLGYLVNFNRTGIHYVWVRGRGDTDIDGEGSNDSVHFGLDGLLSDTADKIDFFPDYWSWSQSTRDNHIATLQIDNPGVHTVNMWMREDGLEIDKFIITQNPAFFPVESATESIHVNAGGPELITADVTWSENSRTNTGGVVNTGETARFDSEIDVSHESIPQGTPPELFMTERYDLPDNPEMQWSFSVTPGIYTVRLYFSEIWPGAFEEGRRVFDVLIEGESVLNDYDVFAEVGANKGVVKEYTVSSDELLTIDFEREIQNPAIKAIEINNAGTESLELAVNANGVNAQNAPGVSVSAGDPVVWEFLVSNTGSVAASDIEVEFSSELPVTDNSAGECSIDLVAAGESASCTIESVAQLGQAKIVATATTSGAASDVTASSDGYYFGSSALSSILRAVPSTGDAPLTVTFSPDATTQTAIELYQWDFDGDGNIDSSDTVGRNFTYTYTDSGAYNATLTVTDTERNTATSTLIINVGNEPPVVLAEASPSNGAVPLTVTFTATATDDQGIKEYSWDFDGDGVVDETSSAPSSQYTYVAEGVFKPVLIVTDNLDAGTTLQVPTIDIRTGATGSPTVSLAANITSGLAPLAVNLSATTGELNGDSVVLWEWDFNGDGDYETSSTTSSSISHTFNALGVFYPRVKITTSSGKFAEDAVQIEVEPSFSLSISADTIDTDLFETTSIDTTLGGTSRVSIFIEDASGNLVSTLVPFTTRVGGVYADVWDGTNNVGDPVPEGQYRAILAYEQNGSVQRVDLALTTGGGQYNPGRTSIPSSFQPYANNPLVIDYTLTGPAEVTAFIGRFNVNARLLTFFQRDTQGRGTHRITWHGENNEGQLIHPPDGDSFLFGIFAYRLPDNAIYVQNRIDISDLSAAPPIFTPTGREKNSVIKFTLSKPGAAEVEINDTVSGAVRRTAILDDLTEGENEWQWDALDDNGDFVSAGSYRIGITGNDDSGVKSTTQYTLQRVYY